MKDFIDATERELVDAVRNHNKRSWPARGRRALGTLPLSNRAVLATAGTAAVAATVVVLSGVASSGRDREAFALPILKAPSTDATRYRPHLRSLEQARMDFAHARAVATPLGQGYAMTSTDGRTVCLAIPDSVAGFGASCKPIETAEDKGMVVEMTSPGPSVGPSEVVVLLPSGASTPRLVFDDGTSESLHVRDGVAAATIPRDGTLSFQIAGHVQTRTVHKYEPQGLWYIQCRDGQVVTVRSQRDTTAAGQARACATHGGRRGG